VSLGAVLRALAIAIAVAGAIDPAIAWSHRDTPVVSLVAVSVRDRDLADRAARALASAFTVVTGPDAGASAVVVAGDRAPEGFEPGSAPGFALVAGGPSIERVDIPERADLESRVPVHLRANVGAGVTTAEARLRVNGLIVDRRALTLTPGDSSAAADLEFAPTAAGLARIRVEVAASAGVAVADAAVDIQPARWKVLSFDPHPSYAATFVRRALESDRRFVVTSRVATSPHSSTETGQAPASLAGSLDDFDLIVAGAPDALSAADVDRLAAFARRGGVVCLVMDRIASGPFERLTAVKSWTERQSATPVGVDSGSARLGKLLATDLAVATLDSTATPVATALNGAVVWQSPLGSGRIVTSGALDAWRQRAASGNDFDRFWQTLAADAAAAARRPIDVRLGQRLFAPGERMAVRVALGDPAAAVRGETHVTARLDGPGGSTPVRLWPDRPGVFIGSSTAPLTPGEYRLSVSGAAGTASDRSETIELLVAEDTASVSDPAMLAAWATAHGGAAFTADQIDALAQAIGRRVRPVDQVTRIFPMRTAWWLPPFALALAGEWWLRRRRGRP
jgi:hypothetical protein